MNLILRKSDGVTAPVTFFQPWRLFDEFDALASQVWTAWKPFTSDNRLAPRMDVYEEKGQLVMKTELPGIDKKDLDISLEGDRLTIKAEKKEETKEDAAHHTRERYYGQYFRSITLPYPVKEDKITATFDKGVLELRLPVAEEVKSRKIEVKAALPGGDTEKKQRKPRQKKELNN